MDKTDITPFPCGAHTLAKGDSNEQSTEIRATECQIGKYCLCQIDKQLSVNAIDKNIYYLALAGAAQLVGGRPVHQRVTGLIPSHFTSHIET